MLRRIGEEGRIIQEFMELGTKAKAAASEALDAEAALGEIPDEFLDPIQVFICGKKNLFNRNLNFVSVTCSKACSRFFFFFAVHTNERSSDTSKLKNYS